MSKNTKKPFASYEKTDIVKIERIDHTIRLRLNARKIDVMDTLKNVPGHATISMIVDDIDLEGYSKIVFSEEFRK